MEQFDHDRIDALLVRFADHFGHHADIVVQAPGRVNLIGEHTDYNGLPVLPMAIDRSILVAGAARDDHRVRLATTDSRFPPRSYGLRKGIRRFAAGDWGNYAKAAAQGLLTSYKLDSLRGGEFLIDGNIPPGAGLSSSSALVVGNALALLAVNDRNVAPGTLAELLAAAERYVGTYSGGMDQAVCLLAEAGHALRVDFDPLRAHPVPLLRGHTFMVCNSLVEAAKSGESRAAYNRRVVECQLACRVLDRVLGSSLPRPLKRFGDLALLFPGRALSDFVPIIENALPPRPLSLREVADIIGTSAPHLAGATGASPNRSITYELRRRARHVLTEAERVDQAEAALTAGDALQLSILMNASHASCRDDFEVSSGVLESLVAAARDAGALGARLTGAGFGGCTVNLVSDGDVSLFRTMIERMYYSGRKGVRAGEQCFAVVASAGASVARL